MSIAIPQRDGVQVFDFIHIDTYIDDAWLRFWHFITFRPRPFKRKHYMVTGMSLDVTYVIPVENQEKVVDRLEFLKSCDN
jgi:hypothetical protein